MKKKMTRLLSLCLTAALLLSLVPAFAAEKAFSDVPADSWYAESVSALAEENLVQGVSDTRFDPNGTMTRAMFVTILSRMGGGTQAQEPAPFADVPAGTWYAEPVAWAFSNQITTGTDAAHFAPDAPVTREQFAAFLWRYAAMRYEDDFDRFYAEEAFTAADPVSGWAQDAMRLSIGAGVIRGRAASGSTLWAAKAACTRAEAVTMLHRFLCLNLTDKEPQTDEQQLDALADASLRLFDAMYAPGKNTAASPLSVLCALAMLDQGASGETAAQLQKSLRLTPEAIANALSSVLSDVPDRGSRVRFANAMWLEQKYEIRPEFIRVNQETLRAAVFRRSFSADTLREINAWVSEQTDGMIPSILSALPDEPMLVLVNALLFQSNWALPYRSTTPRDFHNADGTVSDADMLSSVESLYLHDAHAQGFRKPFEGGRYAFAVLLPEEGMTPEAYLKTLDGAHLRALLSGELYDEVHTAMPKFKTEFSCDLMDVLPAFGITDLSQLDGIHPEAYASAAAHKAVVDVNEDGVSAAAVTAIAVSGNAGPNPDRKIATVIADRPYVYLIVDTQTNLPLFMGVTEALG